MYQTILVPLDGSELAEGALVHAEAIAERFGADIVLFHALASDGTMGTAAEDESTVRNYLMSIRGTFLAKGIKAQVAIGQGRAVEAILRHVESMPVSLIVLSSHGRSGLRRAVMGSVADELMRQSHTPVLVVKNLVAGSPSTEYDARNLPESSSEPGFGQLAIRV